MFRLPYTMVAGIQGDAILPGSVLSYFGYKYHLGRYIFISKFASARDVLEVGCGTGYGSSYLLRRGVKRMVGVDVSGKSLRLATTNFKRENLEFVMADGECLPIRDNSFDLVISFGVIDHLNHPQEYLSECRRVLRDNGLFACSVLNRKFITPFFSKTPADPFHKTEFIPGELSKLVAKYFSHVETRGLVYLSESWWQVRSIAYYIFKRLRMLNLGGTIVRILRPSVYRLVTYMEDAVDKDLASDVEWRILAPHSRSQTGIFMVLGTKE